MEPRRCDLSAPGQGCHGGIAPRGAQMGLTVLSVAYPFATVSRDASGGSEQVLTHLDRALVEAGHRSLVIAPEGSTIRGALIAIEATPGPLDERAMRQGRALCRRALARVLDRQPVDLVHFHGLDFYFYLPAPGLPILTTLHLPIDWYPRSALWTSRPDRWVNRVCAALQRGRGEQLRSR